MHDFTKPWSNDFGEETLADWQRAVERNRPGLVGALRSEIEQGLVSEPLTTDDPTRGTTRPAVLASGWITAQQYDLRDPADVARRIHEDARLDLQSAWVRLDPALRAGAKPRGAVRPGVRLRTEADVATLLEATEQRGIALWIEAGASGASTRGLVEGAAAQLGLDPQGLRGGVLCDPMGTLAETGCLRDDLASALRDLVGVTKWADQHAPRWTTVELSGVPYHDAGATAAQELAFVVATGLLYARALDEAGVAPAQAFPRFVLRFAVGSEVFSEIAKLRAARWLWGRVAAKCGVASAPVRVSVRTGWRNRTRFDPWVNLLRGTVESFAAIVGGADELATQPLTEAIGAGDAAARRWALNTQHLLRDESHVGRVRDVAGGSHYVEQLTHQLVGQAWDMVRRIEATGGMAEALLLGEIEGWVAKAAESRQQALATGESVLVGTTLHPLPTEKPIVAEPVDGSEPAPADARLEAPPLRLERLAEPFERLRDAAAAYRTRTGQGPAAVLVPLGEGGSKEALGRARAVLVLGGLELHDASADAAPSLIEQLGARVAVLCGPDEIVQRQGLALASVLREAGASAVLATVTARETADALRDELFATIGPGLDAPTFLLDLHRAAGVMP